MHTLPSDAGCGVFGRGQDAGFVGIPDGASLNAIMLEQEFRLGVDFLRVKGRNPQQIQNERRQQ
jgi:hypothetical protein